MMSITKGQKAKLKKMIEYHVKAQVKLSWAGSYPPDEADEIEETALHAKSTLGTFIDSIVEDCV